MRWSAGTNAKTKNSQIQFSEKRSQALSVFTASLSGNLSTCSVIFLTEDGEVYRRGCYVQVSYVCRDGGRYRVGVQRCECRTALRFSHPTRSSPDRAATRSAHAGRRE